MLEEFRFANPDYLYLSLAVIVLAYASVFWANSAVKKLKLLIGSNLKSRPKAFNSQTILILLSLLFFILALARPQANPIIEKRKTRALDIIIALDLSRSMNAEDVHPSRLKRAKHSINTLLNQLNGDRVSIVAFAGSAVLVSPLTIDYDILRSYLYSLSTETIEYQGTDIEGALEVSLAAFERGSPENFSKEKQSHIVIVMSDGESNHGKAIEAAKKLKEKGLVIHTIAFGTLKGAPIPERDEEGSLRAYKQDKNGNTVVSRVNTESLKEIAKAGGGFALHNTNSESEIRELTKYTENLIRMDAVSKNIKNYQEFFYYPLGMGLVLLFLAYIPIRSFFPIALLFCLLSNDLQAQSTNNQDSNHETQAAAEKKEAPKPSIFERIKSFFYSDKKNKNDHAIKLFLEQKFQESSQILLELLAETPNSQLIVHNTGTSLTKNKKTYEGQQLLEKSKNANSSRLLSYLSEFNLAGSSAEAEKKFETMQQLATLIDKMSSIANITNEEQFLLNQARKNLQYLLTQQKQKQNQNQKNNKDEQQKQQQDQQQQQEGESDKKKENKDQDGNSEEKKKDKNQNSSENQQQQKKKNQFKDNKRLSEKDAKKILESLKNHEKELQKKLLRQRMKNKHRPKPNSKDW